MGKKLVDNSWLYAGFLFGLAGLIFGFGLAGLICGFGLAGGFSSANEPITMSEPIVFCSSSDVNIMKAIVWARENPAGNAVGFLNTYNNVGSKDFNFPDNFVYLKVQGDLSMKQVDENTWEFRPIQEKENETFELNDASIYEGIDLDINLIKSDFNITSFSIDSNQQYWKQDCLNNNDVWVEPHFCYDRTYLIGLSKALKEIEARIGVEK